MHFFAHFKNSQKRPFSAQNVRFTPKKGWSRGVLHRLLPYFLSLYISTANRFTDTPRYVLECTVDFSGNFVVKTDPPLPHKGAIGGKKKRATFFHDENASKFTAKKHVFFKKLFFSKKKFAKVDVFPSCKFLDKGRETEKACFLPLFWPFFGIF